MYRDDRCAVCGESLPPDHFYCREHGADVDDRLHDIAALLPQVTADLGRLAELLTGIAQETWDYLAEDQPEEVLWPPAPVVQLRADAEAVTVDVDSEPGYVQVRLALPAAALLGALARALTTDELAALARTCAHAEGANATH